MIRLAVVLALALAALSGPAAADEGLWPLDQVPAADIEAKLGVSLSPQWLERARLATLEGPGGCSSSFVSPHGLVLTNHHCVRACVGGLAPDKGSLDRGFLAATTTAEVPCRQFELEQLVEIRDVTAEVRADGADDQHIEAGRRRVLGACRTTSLKRCRLLALDGGEAFRLYRYRRFGDVRIVFAPEVAIADFGGEPYNFAFPRFALDAALVRVYEGGRPLDSSGHFLRWSAAAPADGDPVFVVGKPMWSHRDKTLAELGFERDVKLTRDLLVGVALKAHLEEFGRRGEAQRNAVAPTLLSVTNTLKYYRYSHRSLGDPALLRRKAAREEALRSKASQDAELSRTIGDAWSRIEEALGRYRSFHDRLLLLEGDIGYTNAAHSALFDLAFQIVRRADESSRPEADRLEGFGGSRNSAGSSPALDGSAVSEELELAKLAFLLSRMAEDLDPNDPVVRAAFKDHPPAQLAQLMVTGTRLTEAAFRDALIAGRWEAVQASTDPLIVFMRDVIVAPARELRLRYEREVSPLLAENRRLIASALQRLGEAGAYPAANDTLRLSYGKVAGSRQNGADIAPFTTIGGAFERSTGHAPLALPKSWRDAEAALDRSLPLNVIATADVASGNSGSPMLNGAGELVGLVFDCNVPSVCGSWGFDEATHRVISVHAAAILEILGRVYGAAHLVDEMRPPDGSRQ